MHSNNWLMNRNFSTVPQVLANRFAKDPFFDYKARRANCAVLSLYGNLSPVQEKVIDFGHRYACRQADNVERLQLRRELTEELVATRSDWGRRLSPKATLSVLCSHGCIDSLSKNKLCDMIKPLPSFQRLRSAFFEIYGNPFFPKSEIKHIRSRISPQAEQMAKVLFEENLYGDLPFLADCLEDGGFGDHPNNQLILQDLRRGGNRPFGCWSFDLILGYHFSF